MTYVLLLSPKNFLVATWTTQKNWQRLVTGKSLVGIAQGWGKSLKEGRLVGLMTYLLQGGWGFQSERRAHCNAEKTQGWGERVTACRASVSGNWKAVYTPWELCALGQPRPDTMGQAHTVSWSLATWDTKNPCHEGRRKRKFTSLLPTSLIYCLLLEKRNQRPPQWD